MAAFSPEEELALLGRLRSGLASEREAVFNSIFERLWERAFALCRNLLGNRNDAEDATQECFMDVYRGLRGFRGDSKLSTWVYRVAIGSALRIRGRRRDGTKTLDEVREQSTQAPAPDEVASAREELQRLEQALARLNVEHRTVLSLFAIAGLGHEEIAEVLGIPTGTVWSRLHAARKQLRAAGVRASTG